MSAGLPIAGYDRPVPDRLHFTDSDEANALIASDPMALLVGFALDQQVTVQKAFAGPLVLRERLGALDAGTLASADLEPVFRAKPALHRYPGSMAGRVHDLAVHVRDRYDGDAARVWADAIDSAGLRCLAASPRMLLALKVLAHRVGEDEDDVLLLARQIGLVTASEVLAVAEEVFGDRLDTAARFFVEELFGGDAGPGTSNSRG